MLGRRRPQWRAALIGLDLLASAIAFLVAGVIRFGSPFVETWEQTLELPPVPVVAVAFPAIVGFSFGFAGLYRRTLAWSSEAEVRHLGRGLITALAITLGILFWFRLEHVSRIMIGITFTSLAVTTLTVRFAVRRVNKARYEHRLGLRNVLLVGSSPGAKNLRQRIQTRVDLGMNIVGRVGASIPDDVPIGALANLKQLLKDHVVDDVVLCLAADEAHLGDELIASCREQGKSTFIAIDVAGSSLAEGEWLHVDTIPILAVSNPGELRITLVAKRAMDVVISTIALVALSPLFALISVAIVLRDGRPAFFSQERGGLSGRTFPAHKFRTMINNAEEQRESLVAHNERVGPVFKIEDDPRITSVGHLLRKTSLDELPQLWNVLKGEMSLVGPRPQPVIEVAAYDFWHRRRLSMRPGITGLWQITARHDPDFNRWMELDLQYIDRWSLLLDLRILVLTPWALIRTPGV